MATGSYGNFFRVFSTQDNSETTLESSRDPQRRRFSDPKPQAGPAGARFGLPKKKNDKKRVPEPPPPPSVLSIPLLTCVPACCSLPAYRGASVFENMNQTDFASKLVHLNWHPEANLIAAAAFNSLYLFTTT